ncbi:bacteriochlorophyll 4-vinyl reductase [Peteryoungia desertarenae]|uniref:Bacteriochlorophyll 4-vinyl reductase n=1 Tax=Peteryoungia desertarenae TaxID=1813451 RepID=A0ABX6QP89_9HYPH|nr:bacteriochlorophyll 4-vinyl reductase [Peteryoungia desertarenae]QLF70418.1 bacteriochlorophyll 4-vinyl reductase [Peteryoungia desertarenae]
MPTSDNGLARLFADAERPETPPARPPARIGPNAIIQTGEALSALDGPGAARLIFEAAGLGRYIGVVPTTMIDEREPVALFAAVQATLPPAEADRVLADAGHRTGHYILENRIPPIARQILPKLPPGLSSRLLVSAIARHAWTFAGSGSFEGRVTGWTRPVVTLAIAANPLATAGCPWHGAVFQRLFASLCGNVGSVRHSQCCARGDGFCVTQLSLAPIP